MARLVHFNGPSNARRPTVLRDMLSMRPSALVRSGDAVCECCHGELPAGVLCFERNGKDEKHGMVCTTCVQGVVTAEAVQFASRLPVRTPAP